MGTGKKTNLLLRASRMRRQICEKRDLSIFFSNIYIKVLFKIHEGNAKKAHQDHACITEHVQGAQCRTRTSAALSQSPAASLVCYSSCSTQHQDMLWRPILAPDAARRTMWTPSSAHSKSERLRCSSWLKADVFQLKVICHSTLRVQILFNRWFVLRWASWTSSPCQFLIWVMSWVL